MLQFGCRSPIPVAEIDLGDECGPTPRRKNRGISFALFKNRVSEMNINWIFPDPEQTEVITLDRILRGESPLRLVTHDEDDDSWQFLDGEHVFEEDAVVLSLEQMVQFDPSLVFLADLPIGSFAWRTSLDQPWRRAVGEPPTDLFD